ncbi:hypothetical protein ACLOAV_010291 [Pseudogymnoascus australis]
MLDRRVTPLDEPPLGRLPVPFSPNHSVTSLETCLADLPASIVARGRAFRPARDLAFFLRSELEPWRIDRIYDYLWFARDRILQARALHRHEVSRRQIVITESPSEHLISDYSVIFVKPLPGYLLSYEFWDRYLSSDPALHSVACGLLLSYTWLVAYRTDFDLAKERNLVPKDLDWNAWTTLATSFLDHLEASDTQLISKRYLYGELLMSRINYIYKLIPSLWFKDNPMRGFMPTSMWNGSFLERNIARLLGAFVFFSLILSAMQVGLATNQLQENPRFLNASYGFVVASLFIVSLCAAVSLVILIWHIRYKILLPWKLGLQEIRGNDF